jgi:hypothetical protein
MGGTGGNVSRHYTVMRCDIQAGGAKPGIDPALPISQK